MYTVSDGFKNLALGSHRQRCQVDVLYDGQLIAENLPVTRGSVTIDAARPIRWACSLTFNAEALVPVVTEDPLYPAANEIALKIGIDVNGLTEWVPYGVYTFEDVGVSEGADGLSVSIEGSDRAAKIDRALLVEPKVITKGTYPPDGISDLLSTVNGIPGLVDQTSGDPATDNLPLIVYQEEASPWASAVNIATAFGYQLYMDRNGVPTLADIPSPDNANPSVIYDVDSGAPVIKLNRNLSTVSTYNGVVASGEGTDLVRPLKYIAWDTDPSSPFYYEGPYGQKPLFYSSPLILTLAQCQKAAQAKLKQVMGGIETLTWDAVPHPALDVYDVVQVTRGKSGVNDQYVIESISMPLGGDPMTCNGRTSLVAEG
jgi:Domain of unknown function (DUF5047)